MDIRNRGRRGNYKKIKRRAPADQTTKANKPMLRAWIHGLEMGGINEAKKKKKTRTKHVYRGPNLTKASK